MSKRAQILLILACSFIIGLPSFANEPNKVKLLVLGIAQDAGYPQLNCYLEHCLPGWKDASKKRLATSLAVIDESSKKIFVLEATPDIKEQFYRLNLVAPNDSYQLGGILLTHAHIGHYTGLMHFGREAAGTKNIPVFAMPRMARFLKTNGPWSQLVKLKNIIIRPITANNTVKLTENIKVTAFKVPHRDEYSETVGYQIEGPHKKLLFIPDIDKWQKWDRDVGKLFHQVDYAFIDGTFFSGSELPGRNMAEIPHPFVIESMKRFQSLPQSDKNKVYFIHFNHSNPLLWQWDKAGVNAKEVVEKAGFHIAQEGLILDL